MSSFWHWYIVILVVVNLGGCAWILMWSRSTEKSLDDDNTTGHSFDGIQEYNNPLPRWWLFMFWGTLIFGAIYLSLYPGTGAYDGILGWTSTNQWQAEVDEAKTEYDAIFEGFAATSVENLVNNPQAMEAGRSLFLNTCSTCHGSDARGAKGFPNLTDNDWLYGNSGDQIVHSITHGRTGIMPPLGAGLGETGVDEVVAYVRTLSGQTADTKMAKAGEAKFAMCSACHGADGTGNQALGAPNLTDDIWLYGGSEAALAETIMQGRNGSMPAHKELLTTNKIHVLAAYVLSLSSE